MKVRVDELKDIPSSIVLSSSDNILGDSWTCPETIVHQGMVGGGLPDEDPTPNNGDPHPMPDQDHFHPNQNHFLGPFDQHQKDNDHHNQDVNGDANGHNMNLDLNLVDVPAQLMNVNDGGCLMEI